MAAFNSSFSQVILYVRDMASAVHFYRDLLGLPLQYPAGLADYSAEMWVEFDTGSCTLALHGGVSDPPGAEHELVFTVDHIQEARAALIAAGIAMEEIRPLETGAPIASGLDPNGHRFSIREKA
jgi:catechol 2,3-dioxygenase-like lactoylglutathione lyase family enzyme